MICKISGLVLTVVLGVLRQFGGGDLLLKVSAYLNVTLHRPFHVAVCCGGFL